METEIISIIVYFMKIEDKISVELAQTQAALKILYMFKNVKAATSCIVMSCTIYIYIREMVT